MDFINRKGDLRSKTLNLTNFFVLIYVLIFSASAFPITDTFTPTPSATPSFTQTFTFTEVSTPVCDSEGNTHVGDYPVVSLTTGYMFASRYYLSVGTIQQINVYCSSGATGNIAAALYSDIAGIPGTNIISSGSQGMINGWNPIPLDYGITIAGYYWIAFQFSAAIGPNFNSDTVGVPDNSENTAYTGGIYPTWPGTWNSVSSNMALFSMYAVDCNIITATITATPTQTALDTFTATPMQTALDTFTVTPTQTAADTFTVTPTQTAADTFTVTPTQTAVYTSTATQTFSNTATAVVEFGNQSIADGSDTIAFNSADFTLSFRFTQRGNKTINNVRFFTQAGAGISPVYNVAIMQDSGGYPDQVTLTAATFSTTGWNNITLPTYNLTDGEIYHVVFTYNSGMIDLNNYMIFNSGTNPLTGLIPLDQSTDSSLNVTEFEGAVWQTLNHEPAFVVGYTDSTYFGNPAVNGAVTPVFLANESAENFTAAADYQVNKIGVYLSAFSPPVPDAIYYSLFDMYLNASVTSGTITAASTAGATYQWYDTPMDATYTIHSAHEYRLTLSSPAANSSHFYYVMGSSQAVDQLPENSLNYQGTTSYLQTSSNNGTSWVSNYASDACFRFSLDPSQPTLTMTFTQTPTATAAATGTASNTVTATTTISPTYTDTPTVTVTATVTLTPESTPDDNNVLDKNYADVSKGDVVNIRVNTAAAGTAVKVKVYNLTGGVIRKFSAISNAAGWNDITWDIKNDGGKTVGQGLYFIEIESQGVKKLRRIYVLK